MVGGDGLTAAVEKEIDGALNAHGLIKVRVLSDDRAAREEMFSQLADKLGAAPIQHIGKLLVLWRPIPPKEKAARDDRQPGPRTVKLVSFSKSGNHRATVRKVKVFGNERVTAGGYSSSDEVLAGVTLARHGAGIFQAYRFTVEEELRQGRLVELLKPFGGRSRPFNLLYPHQRHVPLRVRCFVDFLLRAS